MRACDQSLKSYFVQRERYWVEKTPRCLFVFVFFGLLSARYLVLGNTQPTYTPQVTWYMLQAVMKVISLNSGSDTTNKDINFHSLSPSLIRKNILYTQPCQLYNF